MQTYIKGVRHIYKQYNESLNVAFVTPNSLQIPETTYFYIGFISPKYLFQYFRTFLKIRTPEMYL